jgi:hypothetical protein
MSGYLYDARRSSRRIGMPSLMSTLAKLSLLLESCDLTTGHLFEVCFTKCFPLNYFGPAAPSYYSSMGVGPSNCFFFGFSMLLQYSSAGFLVPRITFFRPAAPSYYSSVGFGPSNRSLWVFDASTIFVCGLFGPLNHFLWASCAFILFECGLRSLESFSLGFQCLCNI